jgi:beta-galactosidase/beta-glucuronidase
MQRLSTLSLLTGLLFLIITGHFSSSAQSTISLQGDWALLLDPTDKGVRSHYWNAAYPDKVKLPGSLTSNGIGDTISVNTPWTGDLIDSTFFRSDKYKTYREGHVKVPFWLNPTRYYVGPAWYKRSIDVPEKWLKQKITLNLERCHWETSVYINGTFCGARNSLVAPHRFDVTPYLKAGRNSIVIRVDNRIKINVGPNSHSVSDHTQTNWNGLIGGMSLQVSDRTYIDDVQIHSDIAAGKVNTIIKVRQDRNRVFEGTLAIKVGENGKIVEFPVRLTNDTTTLFASYKIDNAKLWDEFSPNLYTMSVQLKSKDGQLVSDQQHTFGLRELGKKDTRITVNGRPVFLRGDVDCAAFPLTGFPPTSEQEWETIMKTAKDYGLNHLRFHSWCPPDAAFRVADRLGLYLYVEAPLWANQGSAVGTDGIIDRFIYDESLRIIA